MKKTGILFLLLTSLFLQEARGQYFVLFTGSKDGRAIADLSVHMTYLPDGGQPHYGFYITDNTGLVSVPDSGTYLIQVAHPGFRNFQDTLKVYHQRPKPLIIQLKSLEYDLNEFVVTGEFEIKTVDQSLNKVRSIDRKRIERQGAVNLRDLLSNELNIRLSVDPELGTGMSLQGVSGQNIKILIDGVPVIGRTDGTIDLTQINLANIERVEIIEGPMSVMYGSDALGGVINLITKKSTTHTWEGNANSYHESNGTWNFDGRAGFRKKKVHAQVSGGRNFFEGVAIGNDIRSRTWKPKMQYFGDFVLGYRYKNSLHRIQSSAFYEKLSNKSEPVFTPYAIYARDTYFHTFRTSNALFSDFRLNAKSTFNSIVNYSTYSRIKATYRKDLVNLTERMINETDAQDTARFTLWMFRGVYTHRFNKKWQLQTGYDINLESGSGKRLLNNRQFINDYAVFGSVEYVPVSRVSIKAGSRFIYNSRYGAPVVPSLNTKIDITSWMALRASYARGFRAPGLKELSLYFVDVNHNIQGNENLSAERSNNYNMSLSVSGKALGWIVRAEPSVFYNEIFDMISLVVVNPQIQLYQYANIDYFRTNGMALTGEARREGMQLSAGFSRIGRFSAYSGNSFLYSNEYRFNGTYTIPKLFIDLSVFYKLTGATPGFALDENSQVVQTRVDSYQNLDVTASRNFWKRRITLVVGAKNLMDVKNVNFSGPSTGGTHGGGSASMPVNMGRTLFVNLRFNLIKMK